MNDYICEHLEHIQEINKKRKKKRTKEELDILYNDKMILPKNKSNENIKQRI